MNSDPSFPSSSLPFSSFPLRTACTMARSVLPPAGGRREQRVHRARRLALSTLMAIIQGQGQVWDEGRGCYTFTKACKARALSR